MNKVIAESVLIESGTVNLWTPSRIKKYLRQYDLGPGPTEYGRAKHRYRIADVEKAKTEMLDGEPKDENGIFLNPILASRQGENSL